MSTGRDAGTAVTLSDMRVMIIGGESSNFPQNTAEFFDPIGGTFSSGGTMSDKRSGQPGGFLANGIHPGHRVR